MRRALRPLLSALCLAGCRPASPAQVAEPPSACDAPGPEATEPELGPPSEPEWGARVSSVELHGLVRVPAQLARGVVTTHVGDALSEPEVSADLRALLALEVFEDAAVETEPTRGGVRLRYLLRERKQIARVELRGLTEPGPGRWAPLATGELYDPARVRRAALGLEDHLSESGYLEARVEVRQRVGRDRVDVCLWVERGQRWLVSELTPHGNERVSRREIVALIDDHDGRANRPGAPFRADLFEADRVRIAAYYYDRGFLDARVGEPELDRLRGRLLIPIHEGAPYRISSVTFAGKLRGGDQKYRELLGVAPDQLFSRSAVQTGLERVASHHRALGRTARATPETTLDARNHRVSLRIVIEEDAP
ncbi:MAG: hypothetical protein IT377_16080 [Polyangiaceae bacterium]|nr:hypothetical protein [Polyangiaceae bacterium]